jgi:ATP-dependent Clp protease ATP-binding subunit ClpB
MQPQQNWLAHHVDNQHAPLEYFEQLHKQLLENFPTQVDAIEAVIGRIKMSSSWINDSKRPIAGLFLFGPGAEKCKFVEMIASHLADGRDMILRYRMKDHAHRKAAIKAYASGASEDETLKAKRSEDAVYSLFGSPPGYEGMTAGLLSEAILLQKCRIIIFDGIENAHPHVLDYLGNPLDVGECTDGIGRIMDFRSSFIMMTSDLSDWAEVRSRFGDWFCSRIDRRVFFPG